MTREPKNSLNWTKHRLVSFDVTPLLAKVLVKDVMDQISALFPDNVMALFKRCLTSYIIQKGDLLPAIGWSRRGKPTHFSDWANLFMEICLKGKPWTQWRRNPRHGTDPLTKP